MAKFTTLSVHIGDGNHTYEPGEPRETDEPNTLQHLINDKVLGPYDADAEAAWRKAKEDAAEPKTKADADESVANAGTATGGDLASRIEALTKERDASRADLATVTAERDSARSDLDAANKAHDATRAQVEALTKERDELKTKLSAKPAGRGG